MGSGVSSGSADHLVWFVLAVLATWRATHLLANEGRSSGHHLPAPPKAGRGAHWLPDGLLQLHEHMDRGAVRTLHLDHAPDLVCVMAGPFRRRLPPGTAGQRRRWRIVAFSTDRRTKMCCGSKRSAWRSAQAQAPARPRFTPAPAASAPAPVSLAKSGPSATGRRHHDAPLCRRRANSNCRTDPDGFTGSLTPIRCNLWMSATRRCSCVTADSDCALRARRIGRGVAP